MGGDLGADRPFGARTAPVSGLGQRVSRFALLLVELVLIAAVVHSFQIESQRHLFPVLCLTIAGFAIHAWLPGGLRFPFFALLSVASVLFVLGTVNGAWVLGLGGLLMAIGFLPIPAWYRIALLMVFAILLITARALHQAPFWPVLGSMFMFRLISFLHDHRHATAPGSPVAAISYFFLLPNACFPLFPVVDYRTFRESWYNDDEWEIYQQGVTWVFRGLVHLLLYRYIRSHLVPEAYELHDLPHLALFMATNYSLYLQVSGQFHVITGLLHLFGFNLPRTHNLYFLASSCSDIWRRINIYWKDFLSKIVFFPAFFLLRRRGASANASLVASVFLVFVCTWLLHSWQTFWLLGRFPVTINDACLWLGAGTAVAVNGVLELQRGAARERPAAIAALVLSARTVAMFALVSLFWACWTRPGFLQLIGGALTRPEAGHGLLVVLMWIVATIAAGTMLVLLWNRKTAGPWKRLTLDFRSSAQLHAAALALVVAFSSPWSSSLFDSRLAKSIADFRADPAIAEAAGARLQSYYESLNSAAIQAGPLISSFLPPADTATQAAVSFEKVSRHADMYQEIDLVPGSEAEVEGFPFSVNQFGMRDRKSLTLEKPAGTVRIALVGSSIVMGSGASEEEVFARQFESRLNELRADRSPRFQVLNFGVGKQWAPHRLVRIQRKVLGFQPDVLFYFAHQDEFKELAGQPANLIANNRELPSQHIKDVAAKAHVNSKMAAGEILSRLGQYETELLLAYYRTIVDECRSRRIIPVWIYLPIPGIPGEDPAPKLMPIAREAGFIVYELANWATVDRDRLFPTAADYHPNALGHRLIAEALLKMVQSTPETLPMLEAEGRPREEAR